MKITGTEMEKYTVTQMEFENKEDKSSIHYNDSITISDIPELAYEYTLRNRSTIE